MSVCVVHVCTMCLHDHVTPYSVSLILLLVLGDVLQLFTALFAFIVTIV